MPNPDQTIGALIAHHVSHSPDAPALLAPGRKALTYSGLFEQMRATAQWLRLAGVQRGDRVALVHPDGPDMASAFLSVAAAAACAPLNPAYRRAEFEFYLDDLKPKLLMLAADHPSSAREVASERGIPILELEPLEEAGRFVLRGLEMSHASEARSALVEHARPEDVALVLHTSGTTSRPKIVPLSHANLFASARHIGARLELSNQDRCLVIMPLFHIHGLIGAVLSTLASGGSAVCTPGFLVTEFFGWLEEFRPSWYTAVPTMHQAILARSADQAERIARCELRLIRSSSAALPPAVMAELERVFQAPVIESYGMTEAAHQMASNPLPPNPRKPGSVGIASGPEVAVLGADGRVLGPFERGEVAIRGPNVFAGYEGNPGANATAFTDGWFRTGDQGYLDEDRYLFLTGRLKELINRGGEKISPREIDETLLAHPAVAQAVAFAVPDERLGEEVGAAVVLRPGMTLTALELQTFAAERLSEFKIPRLLAFVPEIPKGPTGKLQRIGLAEKLGITGTPTLSASEVEFVAPRTLLEVQLARIWEDVLQVRPVGLKDNFFALGGYSLLAVRMASEVERVLQRSLPLTLMLADATLEHVATALEREASELREPVVAFNPHGPRQPVFFLHGDYLSGGFYCAPLSRLLGEDQPFYALTPCGLDGGDIPNSYEAMAQHHLATIRHVQPHGPYRLAGQCNGGLIAYEMARLLEAEGEHVEDLVLIGATPVNVRFGWLRRAIQGLGAITRASADQQRRQFIELRDRLVYLYGLSPLARLRFLLEKAHKVPAGLSGVFGWRGATLAPTTEPSPPPDHAQQHVMQAYKRLAAEYMPQAYSGPIHLLWPAEDAVPSWLVTRWWRDLTRQLRVQIIPGDHETYLTTHLGSLGETLRRALEHGEPTVGSGLPPSKTTFETMLRGHTSRSS